MPSDYMPSEDEKDKMRHLLSLTRKAVQDYDLIREGDRVCVGVSGGKDSMTLLAVLASLRKFYPKRFELSAVTVSLGFKDMDMTPVSSFCQELDVPLTIVNSSIAEIVFDIRQEKNPCALCANLRRGAVNDAAVKMGCNVVALAHHKDDVIETAMLSLFYEGRFYCFAPRTFLERKCVHVIRPFIYVTESDIRRYASAAALPIVQSSCPMDKASSRSEMKSTLKMLEADNKHLRTNIFGAVKRCVWDATSSPC